MAIRVLLADDHTILRDGLRVLLDAESDITVVADVSDGREALQRAQTLQPDIVVMDISMPELNGIAATEQIVETCPNTQVVILSMHATAEHIFRALQAGAQGYLLKESAGSEVAAAVRAIHAGHRFLSRRIAETLVDDYVHLRQATPEKGPLERLSAREREIVQLVAEGKSSAEIADLLALSSKTVETYRSRLMRKLAVNDLPGLVKFAIQHGLTSLD